MSRAHRPAMARHAAVALLAAVASCDPGATRTPALPAAPRRVVSLAPSCTETLVELGLADRLAGISDYCPELPAGLAAARVGGLVNPNVEAILALRPDLVLTVQNVEDRALAALRRRGVAVHAEDPQSLEEVLAEIGRLGALFGAGARAGELVASLRERLERVRLRHEARGARPRVYVEVDWPQCWTIGRRSFVHDALRAAGGENVFEDLDAAYAEVSKEEILARRPDWVVLLHAIDRPLAERPELAALEAVRAGRVIADLDRDSLLRSSPRLVRGVELLARRLAGE